MTRASQAELVEHARTEQAELAALGLRIAQLQADAERGPAVEAESASGVAVAAVLADAQARIGELEAQLQQRSAELAASASNGGALHGRVLELEHEVTALRRSLSWRLAAPLRAIAEWVAPIPRLLRRASRAIGNLPAAAWHALPISRATRARLERRIFGRFPALADAVSRYSRWRLAAAPAQTQTQTPVASAYASPVSAPEAAGSIEPRSTAPRARLIAFFLPQFHPIPENDLWWGKGFTEWTNVVPARPQFDGHYQPHVPALLGHYDLGDPAVLRRQVDLARHYGLAGFCFYFYWFAGRRLLEQPLLDYLGDRSLELPFCLCWANENWSRRWDGLDQEILMSQEHSAEDDLAFIEHVARYLRDPRYLRIGGMPLLLVYRPALLPDIGATARRWRNWCRENGIGEIYLAYTQSFESVPPAAYGFDAAIEFPPNNTAPPIITATATREGDPFRGTVYDWSVYPARSREYALPDYRLFRGVCPGWDNTARRKERATVFLGNTPAGYREWLANAVEDTCRRIAEPDERLIFVNAWNEWAEGAHLEPDLRDGLDYLEATRAALGFEAAATAQASPRLAFVTHDAHPHGAQWLGVHLCRSMTRCFGVPLEIVSLGEGRLLPEFEAVGAVTLVPGAGRDREALARTARMLKDRGVGAAIANTTVSGLLVEALKRAGIRVVSLVHELPGIIAQYGLAEHVAAIASAADVVVFGAEPVRRGFVAIATEVAGRVEVRGQGLFTRSRYRHTLEREIPRARLRERLGLPAAARVVLSVGYGDLRKGLDLFAAAVPHVVAVRPDVHFVWVGHYDASLMDEARAELEARAATAHFHAVGLDFETEDYYAGADVFALASREDPFPSVVLEALSVGTPVVAFGGAGGAPDLLQRGCGVVAEPCNGDALGDALLRVLSDEAAREAMGRQGMALVRTDYDFHQYVADLLRWAGFALPKVSVVVPNYNYAGLLEARLRSISAQTLPPFEIIVLDDASTDDSVHTLDRLRAELDLDFTLDASPTNSGSVFRQWLRGVLRARGDYVWIAEADDLADPSFLEATLAPMLRDPTVVLSYCQSRQIGSKGEPLAADYRYYTDQVDAERWNRSYVADGRTEVREALATLNAIPNVSAVVFRREALRRVLTEHIETVAAFRVAGDWWTYVRLLELGRAAFCERALNVHRRHGDSVTRIGAGVDQLVEILSVQREVRSRFGLDAAAVDRQREYAQSVYEGFGLQRLGPADHREHPVVRDALDRRGPT